MISFSLSYTLSLNKLFLLFSDQHEDASVRMFDHMMDVNKLLPTFAKYNLADKDVTFIKELISGTALEENSAKVCVHVC